MVRPQPAPRGSRGTRTSRPAAGLWKAPPSVRASGWLPRCDRSRTRRSRSRTPDRTRSPCSHGRARPPAPGRPWRPEAPAAIPQERAAFAARRPLPAQARRREYLAKTMRSRVARPRRFAWPQPPVRAMAFRPWRSRPPESRRRAAPPRLPAPIAAGAEGPARGSAGSRGRLRGAGRADAGREASERSLCAPESFPATSRSGRRADR